jgi:hypothetical protein
MSLQLQRHASPASQDAASVASTITAGREPTLPGCGVAAALAL